MRHILFVDDDSDLLDGLRDALRPRRREWRMTFVTGGEAALSLLARESVDIVVSDLRMPGMDGATLLANVAQVQPDAVRIVLSGHADPETIGRAAAVAHRILVKPSPVEVVAGVIERSCVLLDVTGEVRLIQAAGTSELPSAPTVYFDLMELLASGDVSAAQLADVLERDIAMSAKVLQLANSAYFGSRQPVSRLRDAITLLGHETLRALVLSAEAFRSFRVPASIPGFSLEAVQARSLQVGRLARRLSQGNPDADDAFAAGLLLDVGLLVLAVHEPEYLGEVLLAAEREGRPVHEIELDRHGITHAEIGAHLLALWGLPHAIVEAVAHHHRPLRSPLPAFDAVAVTHIADALVADSEAGSGDGHAGASRIDLDYLDRIGVSDRVAEWQQLASIELAPRGRP
jgi:HD-like signal output (HDOD) protein/ActR/RegA family two-component response regulator